MLEFTGERVIPGLVDPDLLNEHVARYRFAARFAEQARVLDAGCGSGYGTAELPNAAAVAAMDISADAVDYARRSFSRPGVHFLQGACESLPFTDAAFDLLLAFEVIEHLERWQQMLTETARVLRPSGVLLVSTPNKAWYAESRAAAGPNPYHVREFEYHEFEAALLATFRYVRLWSQNHAECISFVPAVSSGHGSLDVPADTAPQNAHFFLAACSQEPIAEAGAFAWLPSAGNILRERQRHISLLETEIDQKNGWLAGLNADLEVARAAISRLESEAALRLDWIRDLDAQIRDLEAQTARGRSEIERLRTENDDQENTIAERTQWARSLDAELQRTQEDYKRVHAALQALEHANLVRLGRKLQLISGKPA